MESLVLYFHNKKALSTRNEKHLTLSAKFQYSENFSLSKTFLFVTANDLLTWVILSILYYFASLLQNGTTLLVSYDNWIMDLCDSVYLEKCFVFYMALYFSHRKYVRRSNRVRPEPLKITSHLHFGSLKDSWENRIDRRFSYR
ncbi:unnamed protein product, partial [Mesorhabditis belari]|uniref:Uncharacterized protein n=1 Tax=Mesorhabditis belari TaxID=2138241 RepID=A0AAF3F661_9BILA